MRAARLLIGFSLALASGLAVAAEVEIRRAGAAFEVRASIEASAPADVCYGVLTDFDRIASFVPDMLSSRIVSRPGEPLLVRQTGRTRAAFMIHNFEVTLAIELAAPSRVTFRRVAGNLQRLDGSWQVSGQRPCRIDYVAEIAPGTWVPPIIGPALMRSKVRRQLEGLEREIERRARSPGISSQGAGLGIENISAR